MDDAQVQDDYYLLEEEEEGNYENFFEVKPWYMWVVHIATASVTFWLQAALTEDRFVPALNVIAQWLEIPDDVAGATLMAAGASTPELFGSFVALFITHSALGIGTIVGSGLFNQLVICAGAVLAARGNELQLNPLTVLREAFFYGLSIAYLLFALSRKEIVDDDVEYEPHIIITVLEGGLLLSGYIFYVIVCANFDKIINFCTRLPLFAELLCGNPDDAVISPNKLSKMTSLTKIDVPQMSFLRHVKHEPSHNFIDDTSSIGTNGSNSDSSASNTSKDGDYWTYELDTSKPSDLCMTEKIEINTADGSISCFLWQQSFFYNKARIDVNAWQLRWFTFNSNGIESRVHHKPKYRAHQYPSISKVEVDEKHLLLKLHRTKTHKRPYILMAANSQVLLAVVQVCDKMLKASSVEQRAVESSNLSNIIKSDESILEQEHFEEEHHRSLITFPENGSKMEKALFILLYPFNAAIHYTIPDVRVEKEIGELPLTKAFISVTLCIFWLVVSSYVLVESLEEIGRLMNIPHAIIGITISAAGTSVANFVASQCAAKQGFGNMAVSNAFGSNSFIIFVGLGLPWFTFCITKQGGAPYYKLRDEGLTESVILMAIVLVLFIVLMWWNNFVLRRRHAYIFMVGYVLYLCFAVGQSYLEKQ